MDAKKVAMAMVTATAIAAGAWAGRIENHCRSLDYGPKASYADFDECVSWNKHAMRGTLEWETENIPGFREALRHGFGRANAVVRRLSKRGHVAADIAETCILNGAARTGDFERGWECIDGERDFVDLDSFDPERVK